jgi:hypothetical protein
MSMSTTAGTRINVEDRIAIHDLVAEYSWRCDTGNFDGIAELFAEDGVWDEQVLGAPRCEGREAIHGLFHALNDADIPFAEHIISNERVTAGDEHSATGTCHLRTGGAVNGTPLDVHGYYADTYVKVDGTWLFASRTLHGFTPPTKVM